MDRTFRNRLLLGQTAIAVVIMLGTATALLAVQSAMRQAEHTKQTEMRLEAIERLRASMREIGRSARRYLLTGDLEEQQRVLAIEAEMRSERRRLRVGTRFLRGSELERGLDEYIATVTRNMTAERRELDQVLARFEDELLRARNPVGMTFDEIVSRERAQIVASRSAQRLARGTQWALVFAAALGVLLTLASTIAMLRVIARLSARARDSEAFGRLTTSQIEASGGSERIEPRVLR